MMLSHIPFEETKDGEPLKRNQEGQRACGSLRESDLLVREVRETTVWEINLITAQPHFRK